jgi:hypothetical protein
MIPKMDDALAAKDMFHQTLARMAMRETSSGCSRLLQSADALGAAAPIATGHAAAVPPSSVMKWEKPRALEAELRGDGHHA